MQRMNQTRNGIFAMLWAVGLWLGGPDAQAQDIDWNVFGPANYFDATNWNPMNVPDTAGEDALIRNGGTVVADGTIGGNPNALNVGLIDVGTELGDGTLFIRDLNSLTFAFELQVANFETEGAANVTSTGRATIERVTTVEMNNGCIDLADGTASDTSTQTANGFLTIRDVGTLRMTGAFDIGDGNASNVTGFGTATIVQNPTLLVENVTNILIGRDLDVCQNGSREGEVETGVFDVTFRNVNNLDVTFDIDLMRGSAEGTGARRGLTSSTGTVVFDNVVAKVKGTRVSIANFELFNEGLSQSQITFDLIDSALTLEDMLGDEGINIARLRRGGTNPDTNVSATLNMTRSHTGSTNLRVGERLDNTAGTLSGLLNLDEASFCRAELLSVGADGDVVFHLDGPTRVNAGTVGTADTYSAIDASDALLLGEIIAEFDFVPPPSSYVFDLIVTNSATALDDTNATFTVRDLDPAFVVDFFGVLEENGVDIVRLQISCIDSDDDSTCDTVDGCPNDPNKTAPGACGCGNPDTDTDGDGTPDCNDGCPNDPNKITPGACGCGTPDTDTDADGTPDCNDGCPNDPNKIAPGPCGCGTSDTDTDADGTPDCNDTCPSDPNKVAPGACGCGTPDTDADTDGAPDCNDGCPNDPNKIAPGLCGCGTADTDTDTDGTPDCNDGCPNDPNKIAPGACGCGVADADSDGDGVADCIDACPGVDDLADANGDGIPDCGAPAPQDLCGLCANGMMTAMAPLLVGLALIRMRRRRVPGRA